MVGSDVASVFPSDFHPLDKEHTIVIVSLSVLLPTVSPPVLLDAALGYSPAEAALITPQ